jgi:hypothetical protein
MKSIAWFKSVVAVSLMMFVTHAMSAAFTAKPYGTYVSINSLVNSIDYSERGGGYGVAKSQVATGSYDLSELVYIGLGCIADAGSSGDGCYSRNSGLASAELANSGFTPTLKAASDAKRNLPPPFTATTGGGNGSPPYRFIESTATAFQRFDVTANRAAGVLNLALSGTNEGGQITSSTFLIKVNNPKSDFEDDLRTILFSSPGTVGELGFFPQFTVLGQADLSIESGFGYTLETTQIAVPELLAGDVLLVWSSLYTQAYTDANADASNTMISSFDTNAGLAAVGVAVTPVPEPSHAALLLAGLFGVIGMRLRTLKALTS